MKKLLITGFDPFDGGAVNPSSQAVMSLPDVIGDYMLCKLTIPTVFGKAADRVLAAAEEFQPDVILCVGLAGGRDAVTPERIAVNMASSKTALCPKKLFLSMVYLIFTLFVASFFIF